MRVGGIDVGLASAAAAFGYDGGPNKFPKVLGVFQIPTIGEGAAARIDVMALWRWIGQHDLDVVYVENATAMPSIPDPHTGQRRGMGAATSARYMRACGAIEATVDLAGVNRVMIMPGVWKKKLLLVGPNKGQSITRAVELIPNARDFLPTKIRKGVITDVQKYHNHAEAILIAVYGAMRCDMIDLRAAA
jgi:hypothetical protein